MTDSATLSTSVIERELRIAARPETVFDFWVEPDRIVQWMGRKATLEPRPGGPFRIDFDGSDIARGEVLEIDRPRRLVLTWGWEAHGSGRRLALRRPRRTPNPRRDASMRAVHPNESLGRFRRRASLRARGRPHRCRTPSFAGVFVIGEVQQGAGGPIRVTPKFGQFVTWSPDGQYVQISGSSLYVIRPDGTGRLALHAGGARGAGISDWR